MNNYGTLIKTLLLILYVVKMQQSYSTWFLEAPLHQLFTSNVFEIASKFSLLHTYIHF